MVTEDLITIKALTNHLVNGFKQTVNKYVLLFFLWLKMNE